jgi:cysteine desulfurase
MDQAPVYYLDNNATTRLAPEVFAAMAPFLTEFWGNPSSAYRFGKEIARHVETARAQVAALIGADPAEIVFTSGGTESSNAAIHSALALQPQRRHLVTTAVEHPATLRCCQQLQRQGCEVTYLPVDADGRLDLGALEQALRPDTALVSVMWANNETGVIFPVEAVAAVCRARGVLFHTDAVQAAGKVSLDARAAGPDYLSLSAHKIYAPKGVGLLYVRQGAPYHPFVVGGHQERDRRGGTENVAGLVGFGRAAELVRGSLATESARVRGLRDRLEEQILARIPQTRRSGAPEPRLPNTSNLAFEPVEAEALLLRLDQAGICASSGSACATGSAEPSHVLRAMGFSLIRARSCLRFSLGRYTTPAEVDFLLERLPGMAAQLRGMSPRQALN